MSVSSIGHAVAAAAMPKVAHSPAVEAAKSAQARQAEKQNDGFAPKPEPPAPRTPLTNWYNRAARALDRQTATSQENAVPC